MKRLPHSIRRQTLELEVGSEALALALQPRLREINRRRLLPAIERVLDELAVPGRRIRIARLELNLGTIPAGRLEEVAERRLERELRRALEAALRRIEEDPEAGEGRSLPEEASRRELLAHWLLHGSLPCWAPRPSRSLEELVLEMDESDPEGLVGAVRAVGHRMRGLERLVVQLGEGSLQRLVRRLEPEHAGLIVEYIADIREVHRGAPVLPLSERELGRTLWLLTQAYLVQDPGSQFNRRSFVKSLLAGMAAREGLDYGEILAVLFRGLERTRQSHPVRSSLPAVVGELVREIGLARPPGLPGPPSSAPAGNAVAGGLAAGAPEGTGTRQLLRSLRDDPERRTALVRQSPPARFDRLLDELCPAEADTLRALLRVLARIPAPYRPRPEELVRQVIFAEAVRVAAGEPLAEDAFARMLRELFSWPLSAPVHEILLAEAVAWSASDRLPAAHGAALLAVVQAAGGQGAAAGAEGVGDSLLRELARLLAERPEEAAAFLRRHAADRRTLERWSEALPAAARVRLAGLLEPRRHRELLAAAEVLAAAWREAAPPGHPALTRGAFWGLFLELLARGTGAERPVARLVAAFCERLAARVRTAAPAGRAEAGARLLESAGRLARAGGHTALLAILQRDRRRLLAPWSPLPRARGRTPYRQRKDEEAGDEPETIYIDNAGLALTGPFLPHLFRSLEMLDEDEEGKVRLRDRETASRAVHLLQFLVDGRTSAPEPLLVLNKILCGVPTASPVERGIELSERERAICEKLLKSMLASWTILSNTSIAGLQETFLQREGRLQRSADGWKLAVERKTLDVLVDEVPWSLSIVLHRWMPQPLQVTW